MWVSVSGTVMAQATLAGHMSQEDLEDTRGCCLLRIIPDEVSLSKISSTELAPWPLCVCVQPKKCFSHYTTVLYFLAILPLSRWCNITKKHVVRYEDRRAV